MGDVAEELFNAMGDSEGAVPADGAAPAAGGAFNPDDFKMPTMEEFLSMLENMDNLSDEEKEELRAGVLQNSMRRKLQAGLSDYLTFFVMLSIMLAVFGKILPLLAKSGTQKIVFLGPVLLRYPKVRSFDRGKSVNKMDPSTEPSAPASNNLAQLLAEATPEQRDKFLASLETLKNLPNLLQTLREEAERKALLYRQVAFFIAIFVVLGVFAFFGYKLYLSLTEKERKREEKLKAKQEKGKKKK